MMIEIEDRRGVGNVPFEQIEFGDLFSYQGRIYIKTTSNEAFSFNDKCIKIWGEPYPRSETDKVNPLDGKLVILA